MSKTEAVTAINNLIKQMREGYVTDEQMDAVIELAIKEGVLETLLDALKDTIDTLRPRKPC